MSSVLGIRIGCTTDETYDTQKQRISAEHSATYVVQMDSEASREPTVALVSGVPYIGMASPINANAKCVSRSFKEIGPAIWEVEATYSTNYKTEPDLDAPWNRPPQISWSVEFVDEPLLYDARDPTVAIANSAGEPLVPPTHPVSIPVLTITRAESAFDEGVILTHTNKTNDAVYWGASAGRALLAGIGATQDVYEGTPYWNVTYTVKFRVDSLGWVMKLLDQGTYYWSGTVGTSQKVPFSDKAFQQIIGNLNGYGGKNTTTTPWFVTYNRYDEADFSTLAIDYSV